MKVVVALAALAAFFLSPSASARHHHHWAHPRTHQEPEGFSFFGAAEPTINAASITALPHPAGCPSRLFCGCGVSVDVFGHPVRSLYLAIEWARRFARTLPAPGMVAARSGHVMRLRQQVAGSIWLVFDPNGGHHGTWLHARSIAGYAIVDPNRPRN